MGVSIVCQAGREEPGRARLIRAATLLAVACLPACAGWTKPLAQPDKATLPEIRSDFRVQMLRGRLQEYAITFAAEVDLTSSSIERRAPDPAIRRQALLWRLRAVPEMRQACFRQDPIGALVDAWTFARQMQELFATGAGSTAFGPFQADVTAVSGKLAAQMREISSSITVSPEATDRLERDVVEAWVVTHPIRDLTFVRESPIARLMEYARERGSTLQSIATIEEVLGSFSQQLRVYFTDLPRQVRGEIELLRAEVLPPELATAVLADMRLTAAAVDRAASVAELMPGLVRDERAAVLNEIQRQRILLVAAFAAERETVVALLRQAVTFERDLMLRSVEVQRLATLEWATSERRAAVDALREELAGAVTTLRGERAAVMQESRAIANAILLRLVMFVVAAVVLAPLVAHVYARVWPRRRPVS